MDHEVDGLSGQTVFIGGTGRCGTNVLKEALARHPNVAALSFELRFVSDPDGLIDFYSSRKACWSPYIANRKLRRLETLLQSLGRKGTGVYPDWELARWFPAYDRHVATLIEELVEFTYAASWPGGTAAEDTSEMAYMAPGEDTEMAASLGRFWTACVNALLRQEDRLVFVADETWSMLFADEIADMLPAAKFVHMVRDPRDVVASLIHQRWCPSDLNQAIAYYRDLVRQIHSTRTSVTPERCANLKLEDLARSPEDTLNKLCTWIGIPYTKVLTDGIDLRLANIGRWKQDLDLEQRAALADQLDDVAAQLGYESA